MGETTAAMENSALKSLRKTRAQGKNAPGLARSSLPVTLAMALVLPLLCARLFASAPAVTTDAPAWNFGTLTNSDEVSHDFILGNRSERRARIARVISSCNACLNATAEHRSIAPGQKAIIHATFDPTGLDGAVDRTIRVEFADSAQPALTLFVAGSVKPAYRITPPEIELGPQNSRQAQILEIVPTFPLHSPLTVFSCSETNLAVVISFSASNRFFLSVRAVSSAPKGRTAVLINLRSGDSGDPACTVKGTLYNPPDLEVVPANLEFESETTAQQRILWIKQRNGSHLRLVDVIAPPGFSCEMQPDPPRRNYKVQVFARGAAFTNERTELVLKMKGGSGESRDLRVPVKVSD